MEKKEVMVMNLKPGVEEIPVAIRAPSISSTPGLRFITMTSFFSIYFSPSRPTLNYRGGSVSLILAQRGLPGMRRTLNGGESHNITKQDTLIP